MSRACDPMLVETLRCVCVCVRISGSWLGSSLCDSVAGCGFPRCCAGLSKNSNPGRDRVPVVAREGLFGASSDVPLLTLEQGPSPNTIPRRPLKSAKVH